MGLEHWPIPARIEFVPPPPWGVPDIPQPRAAWFRDYFMARGPRPIWRSSVAPRPPVTTRPHGTARPGLWNTPFPCDYRATGLPGGARCTAAAALSRPGMAGMPGMAVDRLSARAAIMAWAFWMLRRC